MVVAPAPAHGFSGFGHAIDEAAAAPVVAAPVVVTPPEPIFSGFGHATEEMGGGAGLMGQAFVSAAAPVEKSSTPASSASYLSSL